MFGIGDSNNNFKIVTPHACVIVWNYKDRGGDSGYSDIDGIDETIISTVSCVSIKTSKSKGAPQGTFEIVLAPTKNWINTLTAGSWCAILMSPEPITKSDLTTASQKMKMLGRIESVNVSVAVDESGARNTFYVVTGTDWAQMFNNILYVDNLIASSNDPITQGNAFAIALRKMIFSDEKDNKVRYDTKNLMTSLLNIMGKAFLPHSKVGRDINRLAFSSIYDIKIPYKTLLYLGLAQESGVPHFSKNLSQLVNLVTGKLISPDKYDDAAESVGFIDPFSLQGANSFWQVLHDNSNPAINEMIAEIRWSSVGTGPISKDIPKLTLYNRVRPFLFKPISPSRVFKLGAAAALPSFLLVKTHKLDPVTIVSISASTNWRDKFNFVEVRPNIAAFEVFKKIVARKTQHFDEDAISREGFRPMFVGTKQLPINANFPALGYIDADPDALKSWAYLIGQWHFNTHRMLNGTLIITGTKDYIAVGDNIMFPLSILDQQGNINTFAKSLKLSSKAVIVAHVENISHSFTTRDGAREYLTTIQFVRGVVSVDTGTSNPLMAKLIDEDASDIASTEDFNSDTVVSTSTKDDPDTGGGLVGKILGGK